jgi:hypothetical protein
MRYIPIIAGLFVGLLARCTVNTTPEQAAKYSDTGSYCEALAQAECSDEVLLACGSRKELCTPARQMAHVNTVPLGKTFDSKRGDDCVQSVAAAYADAKLTKDEIAAYTATCAKVFDGTGIRNSVCQTDSDCKQTDGLRCVLGAASATGTCQEPVTVQPGGKCDTPDAMCADGYHCGPIQHCDVNADTGEPCSAALPCKATLKCGAAGTCEPRLLDGATCSANGECASSICADGLNVCVSQITLAPKEPFCVSTR